MMTRIMTMKEISKDWFPSTIADELRLYVAKLLDKTLGSEIKFNHKLVIAHNIVDNDDDEHTLLYLTSEGYLLTVYCCVIPGNWPQFGGGTNLLEIRIHKSYGCRQGTVNFLCITR